MKGILNPIQDFFENFPDMVRRNRVKAWIVFVVFALVIGSGAVRFKLNLGFDAFFSQDDPVKVAYDRFRSIFGSDQSIYIIFEPKDPNASLFSPEVLKAVRGVQEDLLNYRRNLKPGEENPLDRMVDVKTIVNGNYLEAKGDALISRPFIGAEIPTDPRKLEALKEKALAYKDFRLSFVSKDARYGGILIRTDFGAVALTNEGEKGESGKEEEGKKTEGVSDEFEDFGGEIDVAAKGVEVLARNELEQDYVFEEAAPPLFQAFMAQVRPVLEKYSDTLAYYPVGMPVTQAYIMDEMMPQISKVMGFSWVFVAVLLLFLFRSFSAVIWPVLLIGLSAIMTVGTLGWIGLEMNLMINVVVLMVLVAGVADSVHILSGYIFFRNQGHDHPQAMRAVYRKSGLAILLTSLTTAVGMMFLLVVPLDAIRVFGFGTALGVIFAFLSTVFMLPLMLDIWAPFSKKAAASISKEKPRLHLSQKILRPMERFSMKYSWPIVGLVVIVMVFIGYGARQVTVDSDIANIFKEGVPLKKAYHLADKFMGGTSNIEVLVNTGQTDALKDAQWLNAMDNLQTYLETRHGNQVVTTRSLADVVKDTYQVLNGGSGAYYRIPESSIMAEQTLFMFNNANPKERRQLVSDDYAMGRVTISLRSAGMAQAVVMMKDAEKFMEKQVEPLRAKYPDLQITFTGGMSLMARMVEYVSWSQIKGFGGALVVISLMLLFLFGSVRVGLIAILPNLLPIGIIYAMMGYLKIPLDVDSLIIAPITIGIVVDDTIHFLTHYRAEMNKHGDVEKAIINSYREVGQAILFTSIILSVVLGSMIFLDHKGMSAFGLLSSVAMFSALLSDLFFLPALLYLTKTRFGTNPENPERADEPLGEEQFATAEGS